MLRPNKDMTMSDNGWSKLMHWITRGGTLAQMKGAAPKIYIALLSCTDGNFKPIEPTRAKIQKLTGLKKDAVDKGIQNLTDLGLITKVTRKDSVMGNLPNIYKIIASPSLEKPPRGGGENRLGEGGENRSGGGGKSSDRGAVKPATNKKGLRTKTTTIVEELPDYDVEDIVTAIQQALNPVVVAILKRLDIELEKTSDTFRKKLPKTDVELLKYYFEQADKAERSSSGYFITAVEKEYTIPQVGRKKMAEDAQKAAQKACKDFFDRVRSGPRNLVGVDGVEYQVTTQNGADLVLQSIGQPNTHINGIKMFEAMFSER